MLQSSSAAGIHSHNPRSSSPWVSSNYLQLVLLPVIIVGQKFQALAADKRALQTYQDAEAALHEALEIQEHLASQDKGSRRADHRRPAVGAGWW